MTRLFTYFLLLLGFSECKEKSTDPSSRSFYLGFTPFPYAISDEAVRYTYNEIKQNADIVCQHFDDGVPWVEALSGAEFHINVRNDWTYRKSQQLSSQKLLLTFTPINFDRNGLANYKAEKTDMPLPDEWKNRKFTDNEVKTAYLNYCKRGLDFFKPDYFLMGIEVNLLLKQNPALWPDYLEFHQYIYQALKTAYPSIKIAVSFTGIDLLQGYTDVDYNQQITGFQQVIGMSDFMGISFYPYQTKYTTNTLPADMFEKLFQLTDKPKAFTETGYPAQKFSIFNNLVTFEGTEAKQNAYMERLFREANSANIEFIINFVLRDYDQLWQSIGAKDDVSIAWRDTGLIDENGLERAAYQTWKKYFNLPIVK
jgi:hypothetical protein